MPNVFKGNSIIARKGKDLPSGFIFVQIEICFNC